MEHVGETNFDLDAIPTPKSSGWSELENTARQVILAAKLHNESYVPDIPRGTAMDRGFTRPRYILSLENAAEQAQQQLGTSPASTRLVVILLATAWNDALTWATETATGWKV